LRYGELYGNILKSIPEAAEEAPGNQERTADYSGL
jgi:hypothetical protein